MCGDHTGALEPEFDARARLAASTFESRGFDRKRGAISSLSRRDVLTGGPALVALLTTNERHALAAQTEVHFDFTQPLAGWETVTGTWALEEVPGALQGKALVQRATNNSYNVVVAPGEPFTNVDIAVRFKPISGREDASGGIVFRFAEGHYYVIRANALENNFNFYYYEPNSILAALIGGRHYITGVGVKAPALGGWHALRITAEGDHIQGWLNDQRLIDYRDSRYTSGRFGLWTKADSVTAFDDLVVRAF